MVPNIEKFAIQQTVLEQTAVIVKYKFIKCKQSVEGSIISQILKLPYSNGDVNEMEIIQYKNAISLFINLTRSKKERFDMKYFQFNKKYLDIYSPSQDLNHLTNPSWEWRSYAVPTTPQKLERSINKIDIYSNRLPHKYEQYWTAWGYIMQSRTILVLSLIPDKGISKALPLFIAMRGISNNFSRAFT